MSAAASSQQYSCFKMEAQRKGYNWWTDGKVQTLAKQLALKEIQQRNGYSKPQPQSLDKDTGTVCQD